MGWLGVDVEGAHWSSGLDDGAHALCAGGRSCTCGRLGWLVVRVVARVVGWRVHVGGLTRVITGLVPRGVTRRFDIRRIISRRVVTRFVTRRLDTRWLNTRRLHTRRTVVRLRIRRRSTRRYNPRTTKRTITKAEMRT